MNDSIGTANTPSNKLFSDQYDQEVACPWCESVDTRVVSPFGGTVSEVLFRCEACESVFGWMKWESRIPK